MGQASSTFGPSSEAEISPSRRFSFRSAAVVPSLEQLEESEVLEGVAAGRDYTFDLPDECLAFVFQFLGAGDRKRCSLVCKRWFRVDGQNRCRLSLNAQAEVLPFLPSLFTRFDSVTKLALRCDRKSISINDDALILISIRCRNLSRVKLRGCREITDVGMEIFAQNCKSLKKFSCGSCLFGSKAMNAILTHCKALEELSVKRLRGVQDGSELIGSGLAAPSLKSVCLKELINGQCFEPLIIGAKKLTTLKVIRCLGDWDRVLEKIGSGNTGLIEIHLERLQVSDLGLSGISKCSHLEVLRIVKTPECTNSGLICVAEHCKQLRKLHIDAWRTNRIGDEGLIVVAKQCLNLQELVLIGVNPTSLGLEAVASNCHKLERLALCGSGSVGDAEIACIAAKCVALKKLCIKGCPISDVGIESLAWGCPNLAKIKVKKCRGVSGGIADWLRERRESLIVNWDDGEVERLDGNASEIGAPESVPEFPRTAVQALVEIVKLVQKRGWKGTKGDWKEFLNFYDKKIGASLSDPARRSNNVLIAFLQTFDKEDHLQFLVKVIQSCSKRNMVQQVSSSLDDESPEQRLVRLTLEHPLYPLEYSFPSNGQDWVVTELGKKSKVMRSDRILAVDCEMVLCEDGTEALVKVCVVDHNLQVKLDKIVQPNKAVADYRTEITGITAADLEGVTCSLADVQKSMKKLLSKGNILVGHSLSNDLNALKIDHTWVIDTSFIFRCLDAPVNRRPSLSNLCKSLLGYELRKKDAPHNCLDDACAAMKLVIARIKDQVEDTIPLAEVDVREIDMSKLLLHKIPLFVTSEELLKALPGDFTIELKPSWKFRGNKYTAYAIFKNSQEAERAYEDVKGSKDKDSFGRPQKLITLQLSKGKTCSMYVRKMAHGDDLEGDMSRKRADPVEETSNVSKKLKTDENIKEETMADQNESSDHLEEIETSKRERKAKDSEISRPNGKASKHRKDKKGKKKRH